MIYTLSLLMVVALIHIDSGHSRQQTTITPYLTNSTISLKWRAVIKHDAHLRLILTLSHTYPYKYAIPSSNEDNDATRGLVDDIVAFNDATYAHIQLQDPNEYSDENSGYHCPGTNSNHLVNFEGCSGEYGWTVTKTNAPSSSFQQRARVTMMHL
eukprot:112751_1